MTIVHPLPAATTVPLPQLPPTMWNWSGLSPPSVGSEVTCNDAVPVFCNVSVAGSDVVPFPVAKSRPDVGLQAVVGAVPDPLSTADAPVAAPFALTLSEPSG